MSWKVPLNKMRIGIRQLRNRSIGQLWTVLGSFVLATFHSYGSTCTGHENVLTIFAQKNAERIGDNLIIITHVLWVGTDLAYIEALKQTTGRGTAARPRSQNDDKLKLSLQSRYDAFLDILLRPKVGRDVKTSRSGLAGLECAGKPLHMRHILDRRLTRAISARRLKHACSSLCPKKDFEAMRFLCH